MRQKRLLALAMAGAMMTGTLATAVPVFAAESSGTTKVSLTVEPKNTYTMTVPANTKLSSAGTATQLTGGIKITDGTLEDGKKLTVTAKSANSWKMKADSATTQIGYTLYSDEGKTAATSWEFTQEEANKDSGTTRDVYAKANADDVSSAASGEYSDVITFTGGVVDAVTTKTVTLNSSNSFSADGVTYTGESYDYYFNGGKFVATSGNITKITITNSYSGGSISALDNEWSLSSDGKTATYEGGKSKVISFPGTIVYGDYESLVVMTVEIER